MTYNSKHVNCGEISTNICFHKSLKGLQFVLSHDCYKDSLTRTQGTAHVMITHTQSVK